MRYRIRSGLSIIISTVSVLGLGAGGIVSAAPANTVYVSTKNCSNVGAGTQQTPYCTIQKGVDNVSTGGTVRVDKGTYPEQVVIGSGKDNITLRGDGNNTVIQAPATMTSSKTIVEVNHATGVTIEDLTIAGPGASADSLEYGINIDHNGQAVIANDHVTAIRDNPLSGGQYGVGIEVGSDSGTPGQATITNTRVDDYQKNGITVDGKNSNANIRATTVVGAGPTAVNGQNGIQVSRKATATIQQSTIKGNVYTPQTYTATGILLYQAGQVTVSQTTANNNDTGIDLYATKNSTFSQDTTNNSSFNGIYADGNSKGNSFTQNTARNTVQGDGNYDVEDDSTGGGTLGTANTWHQNDCKTSLPAQLCRQ